MGQAHHLGQGFLGSQLAHRNLGLGFFLGPPRLAHRQAIALGEPVHAAQVDEHPIQRHDLPHPTRLVRDLLEEKQFFHAHPLGGQQGPSGPKLEQSGGVAGRPRAPMAQVGRAQA